MRKTKQQLYETIYRSLIRGQTITQIAKNIGYDKGYISRIKDRLIQGGFLIPVNPRSRAVFYSATKKRFSGELVNNLVSLTGGASQQLSHRLNVVKIQKASFICDIDKPPGIKVKWDKEGWWSEYVSYHDFVYPFSSVGLVRFRRLKGTRSDRLLIITPPMLWERDAGDPRGFLEQVARLAAGWIQHRFKMSLSGLRCCQKPDFCHALVDPVLVELAQEGSYSVGGLMVNASAPDGIPEVESKDWGLVEGLSHAPEDIRCLKRELGEIKGMVLEVRGLLSGLLSMPGRVDEFRDVA